MPKSIKVRKDQYPRIDIVKGFNAHYNATRVSIPKTSPTNLYQRTVYENGNILIEPVRVLKINESEVMELPDSIGSKED
jgi:hypothetical protein